MAIAQLTQLHITIPGSGSGTAAVPQECVPPVPLPRALTLPRRVTFAREVTVLGTTPESSAIRESTSLCFPALPEPVPVDLQDIQIHEPVYALFPEEDSMDVSTTVSKRDCPLLPALLGFDHFVWPEAPQGPGGSPYMFDFSVDQVQLFTTYINCRFCRDGSHWDFLALPVIYRRYRFLRFSVTPRKCRRSGSRPPPRWGRTHLPGLTTGWTLFLDLLRSICYARHRLRPP